MKNSHLSSYILILTVLVLSPLSGQSAISIDPDSLSSALITGSTDDQSFTITNSGSSDLHWQIEIDWISMESVTHTKNDYADWESASNQDRINDELWITRCNAGSIFNGFTDNCGWHFHGPEGTQWSVGSLDNAETLSYESFVMAVDHSVGDVLNGNLIPNNLPMVMHVIDTDIYYEVQFHSWTEGGAGGGFSYTRTRPYDFISVSDESGTVGADSSLEVNINIDANSMPGGEYSANIIVTSNDPNNAEIVVPVHLTVTGAANIYVEPEMADFAEVYVNYAGTGNYGATMELRLGNNGVDDLNVSDISVDNAAFTVSPTWTSVEDGDWTIMEVTYVTTYVGVDVGTISIVSDDPDQGTLFVPVYANAVEPPVIDVSGQEIVPIDAGDTLDHLITVTNSGPSDLVYEIDIYNVADQLFRRPETRAAGSESNPILFTGNLDLWEQETREMVNRSLQKLDNETGNDLLEITDDRQFRNSSRSWQLLYTDMDEDVLDIVDVRNVYGDINNEEFLIKWDSYVEWENPTGNSVMFVYIDADQNPATGQPMNQMIPFWDIGAEFMLRRYHDNWHDYGELVFSEGYNDWVFLPIGELTTNYVEPYGNEMTIGVDASIFEGFDAMNFGFVISTYGEGDDVDIVPSWPTGNISFDLEPGWLSVDSLTGVVSPGESHDVVATYNASGLFGGEYSADIVFYNNDPLTPEYSFSTTMDVTGVPNIEIADTELDVGVSYVEYGNDFYLGIENTGTDVLIIQNVTTDNDNLYVDFTSLEIDPLSSDSIMLTIDAIEVGDFSANVTIVSNDPDEPTITVPITSTIIVAPDISATPDAFVLSLGPGEFALDTLTISNSGGSDLDFYGEIVYTGRDDGRDAPVLLVSIQTDDYPTETSWQLQANGTVVYNVAQGSLTNTQTYTWEIDLESATDYTWTIYDAWGDGICCGYGSGEYNLYLDDELIATGGNFGSSESVDFTTGGEWLVMNPTSGTIEVDGSADIILTVDASSLDAGNYDADIHIMSNDPDEGSYIVPVSLSVTSMGSIDEGVFPTEFALHQNFPNPFNPLTSIRYDLPENEYVTVTIYDMLGRQVRQLVDSFQEAGFKSIVWDATNDYGSPAAAGVYLYKIQAGDFMQTRKMVLLK